MKHRQPRIATLINARLNSDAGWTDVVIRNMSAYGAMLQLPMPPRRGTYVELRRGTSVIVGRTIWSEGHRCGIQAQDRIALDGWLSVAAPVPIDISHQDERRRIRRPAPSASRIDARSIGLLFQGLAITLLVALVVMIGVSQLYERAVPLVWSIKTAM